jgi:hypothetical protein
VSDEATNGLHQQQPLPKRGEAWAMSQAERRFASQGHVYFSDSVCSLKHAVPLAPIFSNKQEQTVCLGPSRCLRRMP